MKQPTDQDIICVARKILASVRDEDIGLIIAGASRFLVSLAVSAGVPFTTIVDLQAAYYEAAEEAMSKALTEVAAAMSSGGPPPVAQ